MSSLDYVPSLKGYSASALGDKFSVANPGVWGIVIGDANASVEPAPSALPPSMFKLAQGVSSATTIEPDTSFLRSQAPCRLYTGLWSASAATSQVTNPDEWDLSISYLWRTIRGEVDLDDDEVAPTALTVRAIERLVPSLRRYKLPDFGLNDDGSVAMRWADPVRPRSFALHFSGKRVSAVFSEPLEGPGFAESFLLANAEALLPLMARLKIADLIEG